MSLRTERFIWITVLLGAIGLIHAWHLSYHPKGDEADARQITVHPSPPLPKSTHPSTKNNKAVRPDSSFTFNAIQHVDKTTSRKHWQNDYGLSIPEEVTIPSGAAEKIGSFCFIKGTCQISPSFAKSIGLSEEKMNALNGYFPSIIEKIKIHEANQTAVEDKPDGGQVLRIQADKQFASSIANEIYQHLLTECQESIGTVMFYSIISNPYFGRLGLFDQELSFYPRTNENGKKEWMFEQVFSRQTEDGRTETNSLASSGMTNIAKERYSQILTKTKEP